MLEKLIKNELEYLKDKENWTDRKELKKEYRELLECKGKIEWYNNFFNYKRITIFSREVLVRRKGGYFSNNTEIVKAYNLSDKQIEQKLNELNKNKRTRLYTVVYDFNLKTKKGLKEYKHYLVDNDVI